LVDIVKLINQVAPGQSLSIKTDEYELDDIEELKDLPDPKVRQIIVKTQDGRYEFSVGPEGGRIDVPDQGLVSRGLTASVHLVMRGANRDHWIFSHLFAILYLAIGALSLKFLDQTGEVIRWLTFIACIGYSIKILVNRARRKYHVVSVVHNRTRKEDPVFWVRKRDDIWIALVSLLLGGVLGYFVNMLT